MSEILALRPFVPTKDFGLSKRFYLALGFAETLQDEQIAILKQGSFSFILQKFHTGSEHQMIQMLVRDADAWWRDHVDATKLTADFAVKAPIAPAMQPWGLKVGFITDPSGLLWHVAEVPF